MLFKNFILIMSRLEFKTNESLCFAKLRISDDVVIVFTIARLFCKEWEIKFKKAFPSDVDHGILSEDYHQMAQIFQVTCPLRAQNGYRHIRGDNH